MPSPHVIHHHAILHTVWIITHCHTLSYTIIEEKHWQRMGTARQNIWRKIDRKANGEIRGKSHGEDQKKASHARNHLKTDDGKCKANTWRHAHKIKSHAKIIRTHIEELERKRIRKSRENTCWKIKTQTMGKTQENTWGQSRDNICENGNETRGGKAKENPCAKINKTNLRQNAKKHPPNRAPTYMEGIKKRHMAEITREYMWEQQMKRRGEHKRHIAAIYRKRTWRSYENTSR